MKIQRQTRSERCIQEQAEPVSGVSAPALAARRGWRFWIAVAGLVTVGCAVYSTSFKGKFVLDDQQSIIDNPGVHQLWPPWPAMSGPLNGTRPVVGWSLALNYVLGGLNVWGYHLFNLMVHILCAQLLFLIVRHTLLRLAVHSAADAESDVRRATNWARAAALIWLVHPLHTEAVTYIIQRAEGLMALFYLLTLYCVIRGTAEGETRRQGDKEQWRLRVWMWYALAILSCALGMGCKPVMATAPLIVLLYDRTFLSGSFRAALGATGCGSLQPVRLSGASSALAGQTAGQPVVPRRWLYAGLFATWLVLVAFFTASPPITTAGRNSAIPALEYMQTQPGVILHYLRLSVIPYRQCFDYDWPIAHTVGAVVPPLLLVTALFGLTVWAVIKRPAWGFLGAWFFLILAPTSSIMPIDDIAFEHRMYLPLAAVVVAGVVAVVALVRRICRGSGACFWILLAVLVAVIHAYGLLTLQRNRIYHDEEKFWRDVLEQVPANPRAHSNLGQYLADHGQRKEGIAHHKEAIRLMQEHPHKIMLNLLQMEVNLGAALLTDDQVDAAREVLEDANRIGDQHMAHQNLGLVYERLGLSDAAIQQFQAAVRVEPTCAEAWRSLGKAYFTKGRVKEALESYQKSVQARPGYAPAYLSWGLALEKSNPEEALRLYHMALKINPDMFDAYRNIAAVLNAQGKYDDAITVLHEALARDPNQSGMHCNIGAVLYGQKKYDAALEEFHRALALNANSVEAWRNIGVVRMEQKQYSEALAAFTRVLEINPNLADVRRQRDELLARGVK